MGGIARAHILTAHIQKPFPTNLPSASVELKNAIKPVVGFTLVMRFHNLMSREARRSFPIEAFGVLFAHRRDPIFSTVCRFYRTTLFR